MAKWTTEKAVQELKTLLGEKLVAVVLYGSAAGGDHAGKNSDINLLVTTKELGFKGLQLLSKAVVPWVKQNNPAPMFLIDGHLADLTDVFPVEILDMQYNHQMLYGPDPFPGLEIKKEHVRVELEHELRGKLMQLKSRFTLTEARPGLVEKLMLDSVSTFLVLCKGVLWFHGEKPPLKKMDALRKLKEFISFDLEVFETIDKLKNGEKIRNLDVLGAFEKYLGAIEKIVDNVNQ